MVRAQYHATENEVTNLACDVDIMNGPAVRWAMPQIRELRARADADRPYLLAVQDVIAQWADAEHDYEQIRAQIDWATARLDEWRADPAADPLDIASAQADLTLRQMMLPTQSPSERFHAALAEAITARAALRAARARRNQLRADLDRAEAATAAAYAAAETRSAEHLTTQLDALAIEMRVLEVAGRNHITRPLNITDDAVAGLSDAIRTDLKRLAELPFAITPVRAASSPERNAALYVLRATANAADRKVLWLSPAHADAQRVRADELADTAATIARAHQHIRDGEWRLPEGSLVIVDNAVLAEPAVIVELAEHVDQTNSGLILIDTMPPSWPPQPCARLLRLLESDLPWTVSLGPQPVTEPTRYPRPPDLEPAITQASRLAPHLRHVALRDALTRRDHLHAAHATAYQRHLNTIWIRSRDRNAGIDNTPDPGISL